MNTSSSLVPSAQFGHLCSQFWSNRWGGVGQGCLKFKAHCFLCYLSFKPCRSLCTGSLHTLRNGVPYAKSFGPCCLQTFFPFITFRERTAWIQRMHLFSRIIAYAEGNSWIEMWSLKAILALFAKAFLHVFVLLFLLFSSIVHVCFGQIYVSMSDLGVPLGLHSGCSCCRSSNVWFRKEEGLGLVSSAKIDFQACKKMALTTHTNTHHPFS